MTYMLKIIFNSSTRQTKKKRSKKKEMTTLQDQQLFQALANQNRGAFDQALAAGANPNAIDPVTGYPVLVTALLTRRAIFAHNLMQHGADPNISVGPKSMNPLHIMAQQNQCRILHRLIKLGYTFNANIVDTDGNTPLHYAASVPRTNCIEILNKLGANLNAQNNQGQTPLHIAAIAGNSLAILILLNIGADRTIPDLQGQRPVDVAITDANRRTLEQSHYVHRMTARTSTAFRPEFYESRYRLGTLDERDEFGRTLLHLAAQNNNSRALESIIAAGADLNAQDNDGRTPLHYAVKQGHFPIAQALIQAGADQFIFDEYGMRARDYAQTEPVIGTSQYDPRVAERFGTWSPNIHFQRTTPLQQQQIQTLMTLQSQAPQTPVSQMSPELMYQVFDWMV